MGWIDCGVFPAFPSGADAGNEGGGAEARLADVPDALGLIRGVDAGGGLRGQGGEGGDKGAGFGVGLGLSGGTELDDEEAVAGREELEVFNGFLLAAEGVEEVSVNAFEADGLVFEDVGDMVGCEKDVWEADADEGAAGWTFDELKRSAEDDGARTFATDERSGYVEVVFGQELIQIKAGDAAGNAGESCAHLVGVCVADMFEGGVDLADATACSDVRVEFGFGGGAYGEAGAVVEEEVERFDVVDGLAAHECVDPAGVVADHAADGAAAVGCGVWGKGECELLCGVADTVEHDAGLDVDGPCFGVDGSHAVHVFGEVEDDGDVAALASERGAGSTREDGSVEGAADGHGGEDVGFITGDDDADGDVAVVRAIGGVEGFRGGVKADFSADLRAELLLEFFGLGEGVVCASVRARQKYERGGGHREPLLSNAVGPF